MTTPDDARVGQPPEFHAWSETDLEWWAASNVINQWDPGSHDWDWVHETADLLARDFDTIASMVENPPDPITDDGPIILGSDGRVWNGHHRIVAALLRGDDLIPVIVVPS